MEKNRIFTSQSNNYYYDEINQQIIYLHPIILDFIQLEKEKVILYQNADTNVQNLANKYEFTEDEVWLKYRKFLFFKEHQVFSPEPDEYIFKRLSENYIRTELANVKQIVFEVTDACNLKCKYCAYGEFYNDYDKRENKLLDIDSALNLFHFLEKLWRSELNTSVNHRIIIGFYGGEPLLNFEFISTIIEYTKQLNIPGISFGYSMTTNGMLLDRYMDYIKEHDFMLLISLDGNCEENSYRVSHSGNFSYDKVYANIKLLQDKYPSYFKEHTNFNSVLHNRNSVNSIYKFFKNNFDKLPHIAPLNNSGVREDKQELFRNTYKNLNESLLESENYEEISADLFFKDPSVGMLTYFLHFYSNNVYKNYNSLLQPAKRLRYLPTGTCSPFSRKLFMTVNGKIFPCERISQSLSLGHVDKYNVDIDFKNIANLYNSIYDKLAHQCTHCRNKYSCLQCVFHLKDLAGNPKCHGFMDDKLFNTYMSNMITYLEKHPKTYMRIMQEIVLF